MPTLVKHGSAIGQAFGTADNVMGFDIVESMSSEETYGTEITLKDHNGDTTGLVLGDKRTNGTVSGLAGSSTTGVGDAATNPTDVGATSCVVTSVRANYSNEDFVKYEYGFSAWEGVTISSGGGGA